MMIRQDCVEHGDPDVPVAGRRGAAFAVLRALAPVHVRIPLPEVVAVRRLHVVVFVVPLPVPDVVQHLVVSLRAESGGAQVDFAFVCFR